VARPEDEMSRLRRRGFWLEYASMAWMTVEAAVAIVSAIVASSIALIGFGLDSVIEFAGAAVVVWQLRGTVSEKREAPAMRLIGGTFFALAAYLTIESITDLVGQHRSGQSPAGIAVIGAALAIMPLLALAKRRTGQQLGNQALITDAAESAFCAFTTAAALIGIGLNAWLRWWWADPAAVRRKVASGQRLLRFHGSREHGPASGQPLAGLIAAGNPVHRNAGGRCPASLKVIRLAGNPARYAMIVTAQFIWFSPNQRHSGPSSAWLTSQPMRKLWVTTSSYVSAGSSLARANRSRAATASLDPSARSAAENPAISLARLDGRPAGSGSEGR
jgi:Cation efflux family